MATLRPQPFSVLVRRLIEEPRRQDSCFDRPRRGWWRPSSAADLDLSVHCHGARAGNPFGPAAGPHTQLAQNIVLSWLAGARVVELKTIQVLERIEVPRPCIDARNIAFNVEWSQELSLDMSVREYVAGAMLIAFAQAENLLGLDEADGRTGGEARARAARTSDPVVFDLSVGYDLAGVRSERVGAALRALRDTTPLLESLRGEIPPDYARLREVPVDPALVRACTLSTFHGCPPEEIEAMATHLMTEHGLHVVVKFNPTLLGRERVAHLLHDRLGYRSLRVPPSVFEGDLSWDSSLDLARRLDGVARRLGLSVGFKFTNTLVVENDEGPLPREQRHRYLSGAPLHVLALELAEAWRRAAEWTGPISFSAGIDRRNAAAVVGCGFAPVTVCTDLLKPPGYARLPRYLDSLANRMREVGATTIDDYIRTCEGEASASDSRETAARRNHAAVLARAVEDPRYRRENNETQPRRVGTRLALFDCLQCGKCVAVCPNDAVFAYRIEPREHVPPGPASPETLSRLDRETAVFRVRKSRQIALLAEACNECGNCETHCPETGNPCVEKPTFFLDLESFRSERRRNSFHYRPSLRPGDPDRLHARIGRRETMLEHIPGAERARLVFRDGTQFAFSWPEGERLDEPESTPANEIRPAPPLFRDADARAPGAFHDPTDARETLAVEDDEQKRTWYLFQRLRAVLDGAPRDGDINSVNARSHPPDGRP